MPSVISGRNCETNAILLQIHRDYPFGCFVKFSMAFIQLDWELSQGDVLRLPSWTKGQRLASKQCIKDNKLNEIAPLYGNSGVSDCNQRPPLFNVIFQTHCSLKRLSMSSDLGVKCQKSPPFTRCFQTLGNHFSRYSKNKNRRCRN